MRLALLSDIHGNLPALLAALADAHTRGAEGLVLLGDLAAFGPMPREVVQHLRALQSPALLGCVMGNGDAHLLDPQPYPYRNEDSAKFSAIDRWCAEQLTADELGFLRTFAPVVALELGGLSLLAFHGSPKSFDDVITAITPEADLAALLEGQTATVMAGGHSHTPLLRRYQDTLLINPGSVGLPFEVLRGREEARNPPWAEYALLEVHAGAPSIAFRRVPYDIAPLLRAAQTSGMPHAGWWAEGWLR